MPKITIDGEELEVVRASFPYGGVDEKGLVFVAFTRDLRIPLKMLQRMLGVSGDGKHDRLMDFTHAVTGATLFAPSLPMLKSLARWKHAGVKGLTDVATAQEVLLKNLKVQFDGLGLTITAADTRPSAEPDC